MESQQDSLKGKLLLDGGKLSGSFFHRGVVLICQHDPEGAFGLLLNRTIENSVGDLILEELPEAIQENPIYLGGPVQPGALSYLQTDDFLPEANVIENVLLGHSIEALADAAESYSPNRKFRVFAGYAGWSAGQLESEMESNAWLTHPATQELIFDQDAETLWNTILRKKDWQHRILEQSPEDPSWN
jgi:putative transcriptional regulator